MALAGCGDGDSGGGTSAPPVQGPAPSPTPTPTPRPTATPTPTRPAGENFIIISIDDLSIENTNFYHFANSDVYTPAFDEMARQGLLPRNFHTTWPICTPSRYSLLTGKHASHAQNENFMERFNREGMATPEFNTFIMAGEQTIGSVLQANGYRTGFVGKDHVVDKLGFVDIPQGASITDAGVAEQLLANKQKIEAFIRGVGFDEVESVYPTNPSELPVKELRVHNLDWLAQGALNFIDRNVDEKFFLYVALTVPHGPFEPAGSWQADPLATPFGYLDTAPDVLPSRESLGERVNTRGFFGKENFLWVDDVIDAIMTKVKDANLGKDTTVIIISDHGKEGKGTIYDGGTRTSAMIWRDSLARGFSDSLVANIDLMPTILELAEVTPPALDGVSQANLLEDKTAENRDEIFFNLGYTRGVLRDDGWKYIALRHSPYVLSAWHKNASSPLYHISPYRGGYRFERDYAQRYRHYFDADQLYHLPSDRTEQRNLAADPAYADRLSSMKSQVRGYVRTLPGEFGEFTQ